MQNFHFYRLTTNSCLQKKKKTRGRSRNFQFKKKSSGAWAPTVGHPVSAKIREGAHLGHPLISTLEE